MKVSSRDGNALRRILCGMVTDQAVLSRIASQWPREGLFGARWANLIGGWCVDYLRDYNKPPNQLIQSIFEQWANSSKQNEKTIATVERFLTYLSTEHEQSKEVSSDYLINLAEKHFLQVRVRRELLLAEEDNDSGDPEGAYSRLSTLERIEFGGSNGLVRNSDIARRKVDWLWPGWIPLGELTVIDGDPGTGKSQLTIDLAACLSKGRSMPLSQKTTKREPANSIILSSEDDAATVIGPRLDAAGANAKRIWNAGIDSEPRQFPKHLSWLEREIIERSAKMVVLDPFYGFLSIKIDSNSDHKIRAPLSALALIAHRTGAAIILIRHLNKKSDESPLYRGGGSIAITAHCRSAIILGRDPDDPDTRVMAMNRSSLGLSPQSLAYSIVSVENDLGGSSRIRWTGPVDLAAGDIVGQKRKGGQGQGRPSKMDEYVEHIQELLADGEMPSSELQKQVMDYNQISESTYKRARQQAGVKSRKKGFQGAATSYLSR